MMTVNEEVTAAELLEKVASLPLRGYRFVTMTAVDCGENFVIYYHFDRNFELYTLKLTLPKPGVVNSISNICFAALIVENEIQDLFGIRFENLAIDYEHHFLLAADAPEKPFCHVPGVKISTVEKGAGK